MKHKAPGQNAGTDPGRMFLIVILTFILAASSLMAQVSNYSFSPSVSVFTEFSDGTLSTATGDDGGENISLPFTFAYNGMPYTTARISTNGWLEMGTIYTGTGWLNDLASTSSKPLLCPLWDDLKRDASSTISYKTSGTAPNREFIVQWKNAGWISATYKVNFQITLFESTNVIKFSYGQMTTPSSGSASIGINDETGGAGHFLSVTPGNPPVTSSTAANNSVNSAMYLSSGTVYTFTPPVQPVKVRTDQITMNVPAGSSDQAILRITVAQVSPDPLVTLSSFKFNLSSTTNKNDIDKARVYYTGMSPVFLNPEQFGNIIVSPDTQFAVAGAKILSNGYHYFWLSYDIRSAATPGNFVDAGLKSVDFSGLPSAVPDTTEPPGNRKITTGISGLKIVGAGGHFTSVTQALNELQDKGLSGAVVLELSSAYDTTNERYPIYLKELPGSGSASPVTIRPAAGINRVHLRTDSLAAIIFDGGKYFTVTGGEDKNLLITNSSTQGHAVLIRNGAANNLITKCELRGRNANTTGGVIKFTDLIMSGNLYNTISYCTIRNIDVIFNTPNSLLYATGYSASPSRGNQILYNEMMNFHDNGIYLTGGIAGTLIKGNRIHFVRSSNFVPSSGTVHGIRIDNAPNTVIESNYIYDLWSQILSTYTVRGIYMQGSFGVPMVTIVKNNYIGLAKNMGGTDWGKFYGIDYYGYTDNSIELYFNTFDLAGNSDGFAGSAAVYKRAAAGNFTMKNNIIVSTRGSNNPSSKYYAVQFENAAGNIISDYNDIYSNGNGAVFGNWNGADAADINSWRTLSGHDAHSISKFVYFADTTGPHLGAPSLGDISFSGIPVADITTDIDGELRHPSKPYMGADESALFPLPAEMTAFSLTPVDGSILITFTTASETNTFRFDIERSAEGMTFQSIAKLPAAGSSVSEKHYSFIDYNPVHGTAHYRIKTVDLDGSEKLSGPLKIDYYSESGNSVGAVFPNPVDASSNYVMKIELTLKSKSDVVIAMYDITGGKVREFVNQDLAAGSHRLLLDCGGLASGNYLIRISAGRVNSVRKIALIK